MVFKTKIQENIEEIVTNRMYDRWEGFSLDDKVLKDTELGLQMTLLNMDYFDYKIDEKTFVSFFYRLEDIGNIYKKSLNDFYNLKNKDNLKFYDRFLNHLLEEVKTKEYKYIK